MIVMGSYSKSFVIGSVVGLIGIGICFALEQRWRTIRLGSSDSHVTQSSCVQDETTTSETKTDNSQPCSERLPLNDNPQKQENTAYELLNAGSIKRTEDDVTYLFGSSNMTMHDKSSPGLPGIPINRINFMKQDDKLTLLGDTVENFESYDTLSTELESDVELEDDSKESSCSNKRLENGQTDISKNNSIEVLQKNEKIFGGIVDPVCFPQLDGAANPNPKVPFMEQRNVSGNEINDVSVSLGPHTHSNKDYTSDIIPESRSSDVQDHNGLADNKNDLFLSSLGDSGQFSQLEETLLLQFIRDLLEETFGSISPSTQPLSNSEHQVQDSTLETDNKENVCLDAEVPNSRPMTNKLPYSVIAAIPKKTVMKDKGVSLRKGIQLESDNDEVQELSKPNARSRVRRLVGFFENRSDQN